MSKAAEEYIQLHPDWRVFVADDPERHAIVVEVLDGLWTAINKEIDDDLLYGTNGNTQRESGLEK